MKECSGMRAARASRLFLFINQSINHKIESWRWSCHSRTRCQSDRSLSQPEGYKMSKECLSSVWKWEYENNARVNVSREEITQSVQHKLSAEQPVEQMPLTLFACLIDCFVESHELLSFSCWRKCTSVEPFGARALTDNWFACALIVFVSGWFRKKEREASIDGGARWSKDGLIRTESRLSRAPSRRHLMLLSCCCIRDLKVAYYSFIRVQEVYTTNAQI